MDLFKLILKDSSESAPPSPRLVLWPDVLVAIKISIVLSFFTFLFYYGNHTFLGLGYFFNDLFVVMFLPSFVIAFLLPATFNTASAGLESLALASSLMIFVTPIYLFSLSYLFVRLAAKTFDTERIHLKLLFSIFIWIIIFIGIFIYSL